MYEIESIGLNHAVLQLVDKDLNNLRPNILTWKFVNHNCFLCFNVLPHV